MSIDFKPYSKHHWKKNNPPLYQYFVKSYQELSVQLHSSVSLFVFLQTMIGCWVRSDDCNRRGKSRRNAVQPLCLSYSLILLTLSLCCVKQDKQTAHSCSIQHRLSNEVNLRNKITGAEHKSWPHWRTFALSERLTSQIGGRFLFQIHILKPLFDGAFMEISVFNDRMECEIIIEAITELISKSTARKCLTCIGSSHMFTPTYVLFTRANSSATVLESFISVAQQYSWDAWVIASLIRLTKRGYDVWRESWAECLLKKTIICFLSTGWNFILLCWDNDDRLGDAGTCHLKGPLAS